MNTTLSMILRNLKTELDRLDKENANLKIQLHELQRIIIRKETEVKNDSKS
jgi:hypothetical protein